MTRRVLFFSAALAVIVISGLLAPQVQGGGNINVQSCRPPEA